VKSDYATLVIPAIEFEQPPSRRGGIVWLMLLLYSFHRFLCLNKNNINNTLDDIYSTVIYDAKPWSSE